MDKAKMKQRIYQNLMTAIILTISATITYAQQAAIADKQIEVKIYLQKP
jgi:hypothetical protein